MQTVRINMNMYLVEKFIAGTASEKEAKIVLDWFETDEGQIWLASRFDQDVEEVSRSIDDSSALEQASSDVAYRSQKVQRLSLARQNSASSRSSMSQWLTAASVVFLAVVLSLMQIFYTDEVVPEESERLVVYSTNIEEHREITLKDGTRIRLNENSTVEIPEVWSSEYRTVHLRGGAFFEVADDSLRPFIVEAERAEVYVLGTTFSVKTITSSGDMIVAVSEGQVRLGSREEAPDSRQVLEENMLGILNLATNEVTTENTDVTNYVNWMHGRIVFHTTPFDEVLRQLSHIYDIQNELENEELLEMRLTADFSERSLDNVLETIANSLGIELERDGHMVKWKTSGNK